MTSIEPWWTIKTSSYMRHPSHFSGACASYLALQLPFLSFKFCEDFFLSRPILLLPLILLQSCPLPRLLFEVACSYITALLHRISSLFLPLPFSFSRLQFLRPPAHLPTYLCFFTSPMCCSDSHIDEGDSN